MARKVSGWGKFHSPTRLGKNGFVQFSLTNLTWFRISISEMRNFNSLVLFNIIFFSKKYSDWVFPIIQTFLVLINSTMSKALT